MRESRPITLACNSVPSSSVTVTLVASFTTWLLVTIVPSASMMKPEPRASPPGCCSPPRGPPCGCICGNIWLKGNGRPCGPNWGAPSKAAGVALKRVVMETTAGFTWATRPEKSASGFTGWVTAGAFTAVPGSAGAAKAGAVKPGARPARAVPANSAAARAARCEARRVRVGVMRILLVEALSGRGVEARKGCGFDKAQDAAGRMNVDHAGRLNGRHVG